MACRNVPAADNGWGDDDFLTLVKMMEMSAFSVMLMLLIITGSR